MVEEAYRDHGVLCLTSSLQRDLGANVISPC